jgi:hypothetical protein
LLCRVVAKVHAPCFNARMQLSFPFAPLPRAARVRATRPAPDGLTVAEALNRGHKVAFPRNANAVRVTIGAKTTVVLKADVDTLKGAGAATVVEFGTIKNDAKGHPLRKQFKAWTAAALQARRSVADAGDDTDLLPLFLPNARGR